MGGGARAALFVDIDGTLVPSTSSSQFLATRLGHLGALRDAEDAYAAGQMDNHAVAELDARGWAGASVHQVREWLGDLPLVDGIPELIEWCRAHGVAPYLATLAWSPVGGYLCERFGFVAACGPTLAESDGRYTGAVGNSFDEFEKRDYARAVAARLGLPLRRCAAIGDSRSDAPLFRDVGLGVAFNATTTLRASADHIVDGDDVGLVIPALDRWLARLPGAS